MIAADGVISQYQEGRITVSEAARKILVNITDENVKKTMEVLPEEIKKRIEEYNPSSRWTDGFQGPSREQVFLAQSWLNRNIAED